jgi:hypothetical protein
MFGGTLDLNTLLIGCHDLQAGGAANRGIRIDSRDVLEFMQQTLKWRIGVFQ